MERPRFERPVPLCPRDSAPAPGLLRVFGVAVLQALLAGSAIAGPVEVEFFRLHMPDGRTEVRQGSGLHYGRLGEREGLWVVPDRNGDESANHVIFIHRQRLGEAKSGQSMVATEAFRAAAPTQGWESFNKEHAALPEAVLARLRRQIESPSRQEDAMLDFEGIAIGRRTADGPDRLFAAIETPISMVLEFELDAGGADARAVLQACFLYAENEDERGTDRNDGLEGIAWSNRPGVFYVCEEGTAPHSPTDKLHFWLKPRLMRCTLQHGRVVLDEAWSENATRRVREYQTGKSQTLNALLLVNDRTLVVVDRNGGWIHAVDTASGLVSPWLDLYDSTARGRGEPVVPGLNLRERLARFPGPRVMPYVSIEGMARDADGNLWLIDDPAMPEPFRNSCLVKVQNPPPLPEPASQPER